LDVAALEAKINEECSGKRNCSIKDISSFMPSTSESSGEITDTNTEEATSTEDESLNPTSVRVAA